MNLAVGFSPRITVEANLRRVATSEHQGYKSTVATRRRRWLRS